MTDTEALQQSIETAPLVDLPQLARSRAEADVEALLYRYDPFPLGQDTVAIVQDTHFSDFFRNITEEQQEHGKKKVDALGNAGFILWLPDTFGRLIEEGRMPEARALLYHISLLKELWGWGAVLGDSSEFNASSLSMPDTKEIGRLLGIAETTILRKLGKPKIPETLGERLSRIRGLSSEVGVEEIASIFTPTEIPLIIDLLIEEALVAALNGNTRTIATLEDTVAQGIYKPITDMGIYRRLPQTDLAHVLGPLDIVLAALNRGDSSTLSSYLFETTLFERLLTLQKVFSKFVKDAEKDSGQDRPKADSGLTSLLTAGLLGVVRFTLLPAHPVITLPETGLLRRLLGYARKKAVDTAQGKPATRELLIRHQLADAPALAEQTFLLAVEAALRGEKEPLEVRRRILSGRDGPYSCILLGEYKRDPQTDVEVTLQTRNNFIRAITQTPVDEGLAFRILYQTALLRLLTAWQDAFVALDLHWSFSSLGKLYKQGRIERLLDMTQAQMVHALRRIPK